MAGKTRTSDPHDEAYRLGMAGKPLSSSLLRSAETDDSILDSWREGKADRPDDQPDAPAPAPAPPKATPKPPAPKSSPKGRGPAPRARTARSGRSPSSRRPTFRGTSPSLSDPTGGRLPIGFDGDGIAGFFFGAVFYALVLSVADYGATGPLLWFKAKFLNQPTAKATK